MAIYQGTQRGQSSSLSLESSYYLLGRLEGERRQSLDKLHDGIPFPLNMHTSTQAQTGTEHPEECKSGAGSHLDCGTMGSTFVVHLYFFLFHNECGLLISF